MTDRTPPSANPESGLEALLERLPHLRRVVESARSHAAPFDEVPHGTGIELHARNDCNGIPNRARIFFFPAPALGPVTDRARWVAFFYKRSNLPWSRDRFSYGGVLFDGSSLAADRAGEWIEYAASGFDPEKKPRDLRLALPFTVPE